MEDININVEGLSTDNRNPNHEFYNDMTSILYNVNLINKKKMEIKNPIQYKLLQSKFISIYSESRDYSSIEESIQEKNKNVSKDTNNSEILIRTTTNKKLKELQEEASEGEFEEASEGEFEEASEEELQKEVLEEEFQEELEDEFIDDTDLRELEELEKLEEKNV